MIGRDGFARGEGATYDVTGSQTIVGNSDNSFSYTLNDNTKAGNYSISTLAGTLKVVSRTDKYKISPQANSQTVNYDGFSWEVTGFETDTYEVDGNTYTVSGLEAYANEKEVGEHPVNVTGTAVVKDSKGNDVTSEFEVTPKPGKLIIKSDIVQYTVKYTVTFKVENGEWDDGGSGDKVVTLSKEEAEDLLLLLKNEDIPAVGNKPSNGFKAGGWDTAPRTDLVKDVEFGGVILEKDRDYLVGHGSTIVTIKGSVIKKLKPEKYTINVIFDDGVATTTLTVKGKTTESTTESTTETTTQATTEEVKKPAEKKKDTNAARDIEEYPGPRNGGRGDSVCKHSRGVVNERNYLMILDRLAVIPSTQGAEGP